LTFSEQQYFIGATPFKAQKTQDKLKIWGTWLPCLHLCPQATYLVLAGDLLPAGTTLATPDVKATKCLLGLPFQPKPGKRLAVSALCNSRQHLNFLPKVPGTRGYCHREIIQD